MLYGFRSLQGLSDVTTCSQEFRDIPRVGDVMISGILYIFLCA